MYGEPLAKISERVVNDALPSTMGTRRREEKRDDRLLVRQLG
jgi:hypothetical protein